MKRIETDKKEEIFGYNVNDFTHGFIGECNEGSDMLMKMGLKSDTLPFSAFMFLKNRHAIWKDKDNNVAKIAFILKPDQIECFGSYLGKKKSIRVFREWDIHENKELITRLESEAIGDLCMKCIYENM